MSAPTILVVSNPDMRAKIYRMLSSAGFKRMLTGDGSDDTLELFEDIQPDLVVLCASLEHGDARALSSAMRSSAHGAQVKQILIGERDGPIRTALDAVDFEIDHFLVQPLSETALVYAVRMCLGQAGEPRAATAGASSHRLEVAMDEAIDAHVQTALEQLEPMVAGEADQEATAGEGREASEASEASTAGEADEEATAGEGSEASTAGEADEEATAGEEATADEPAAAATAGGASESDEADEAAAATTTSRDGPEAPTPSGHDDQTLPEVTPRAVDSATALPRIRPRSRASWAGLPVETTPPRKPAGGLPRKPAAPSPGIREPTSAAPEILPIPNLASSVLARVQLVRVPRPASSSEGDGGAEPAPARPATAGQAHEPAAPARAEAAAETDGRAARFESRTDVDPEPAAVFDADTAVEPAPARELSAESAPSAVPPGQSGDLARELRRKMSAMAQRLFPDKRTDVAASLALEPDAAAEIDLASLDMLDDDDEPAAPDEPIPAEGYDEPLGPPADARLDGGLTQDATPPLPGVAGRGHLRRGDTEVASLMARMFDSGFTGSIAFARGAERKSIQFERGRPVFATSDDPRDRMGELLFREGKITREQYEIGQAEASASGRRIGEVLVERGFLKRRELLPAVRRHVEEIIYSLFAWPDGEFSITASEAAVGEQIRLSRHPAAMILEGVRRKYAVDDLAELVGPPGSILEVLDDQRRKLVTSVAELSPAERRAVASFDGERDLEEIAIEAQLEIETTYQLAYGLIAIGVARSRRLDGHGFDDGPGSVLVGETDLAIDRQRVLAKYALVDDADYFALLGVRRDATTFEIKRAYQSARRDYAHDSFPPEVRRELAAELDAIGEVLDEAYQILRREDMRASYLANLRD